MVFSSWLFLIYFLPIVLILYYILPKKRNIVLLVSSLCFYAFGEPVYIVLLLFSSTLDYLLSLKIENSNNPKRFLLMSVFLNIGLLSFFKYADLIIEVLNLFNLGISPLRLALPIGISFYTFQTLSYTIDVYRKRIKASSSYLDYMMYVSMFPQLIAGPIVKYKDITAAIKGRVHSVSLFHQGVNRFIVGLAKKVLIADQLALMHQLYQDSELTMVGAWMMLISYGLHIYYDFSGYSDMAIGLGKMFGFNFLENFNYPYISKSVSEFWQRWHISLGSWFKEYLYFPLGGSKNGTLQTIRNLLIVWALTGLWHGADFNFIFWGLYFGVLIVLEKTFKSTFEKVPNIIKHLYLLIVVTISWTFFSINDVTEQLNVLKALVNITNIVTQADLYYLFAHISVLVIAIIFAMPIKLNLKEETKGWLVIILLVITLTYIVDSSFSPFIYFRF